MMTEKRWLSCADPKRMLALLRGRASKRKLRLFACACVREAIRRYPWPFGREVLPAVEAVEKFADALITGDVLSPFQAFSYWIASENPWEAAGSAAHSWTEDEVIEDKKVSADPVFVCGVFREVFGNPFRSATIDSDWLGRNERTVLKLAQAIYDERRFADLPILADALEEAGCDNADVLAHCRSGGEHVCGCWVVDLLPGKE
jgi:hypothetical protein